jgi:hypothetical protein
MVGSFASEATGPAIFLPEQVKILAHGGLLEKLFLLFASDPWSAKASRRGDFPLCDCRRSMW